MFDVFPEELVCRWASDEDVESLESVIENKTTLFDLTRAHALMSPHGFFFLSCECYVIAYPGSEFVVANTLAK